MNSERAGDKLLVGQVSILANRMDDIHRQDSWMGEPVALLEIQIDDQSYFSNYNAAPNIEQIKWAPPCSNYIQP